MGQKADKTKTISCWNNIRNKPENCRCKAEKNDIVMKINKCWFCLQTGNGSNNIVCFIERGQTNPYMKTLRAMFEFCYRIATEYGIEYAKIKGEPGRYDFIPRLFKEDVAKEKELINGEEVYYVHFSKNAIKKLEILKNGR